MPVRKAGLFVLLFGVSAYLNSLGNGFAYDDNGVIPLNPVVTSGTLMEAATSSYWPNPQEGAGLYRPFTSFSFALEWRAFGDDPLGFHGLNVAFHALVSLLLLFFLLEIGAPLAGALGGAALFAIHPLHTEVVANVVGRGELYAAFFFLLACILYLRGRGWAGWLRGGRLLALGALYLLSLGSKEVGVTLPGALVLLEWFRPCMEGGEGVRGKAPLSFWARLQEETATFLLLAVVLLGFLGTRIVVLGEALGDVPAPVLADMGPIHRILTALSLWPQYARLLLAPMDLVADYSPGVLFPAMGVDPSVVLGFLLGLGAAILTLRFSRTLPLLSLGVLWFALTVLPVSHFFFSAGVLLAERTLYLPSVGLSLAVAGLAPLVLRARPRLRNALLAGAAAVGVGFMVKTVLRNPAWMSTWVVLETLNQEHPESFRAFRARAIGLDHVGEKEAAGEAFLTAATLAPNHHGILVEAGDFFGRKGDWAKGEELLRRAVEVAPDQHNAYRALTGQLLRQERGREAHGVALRGLARAGPDADLWALVSESYILKGDLPAAIRARHAAIGQDPDAPHQWARLGELLAALGDEAGAVSALDRAEALRSFEWEREGP
ncbi:tetratricopeptide repeat protein [Gemmatimonadota bacterium]